MPTFYRSEEGERQVKQRYREILKYWPVPTRQYLVPTREGETFVVESGTEGAPPLVLLHGSMINSAMWMRDVVTWAPHFHIYAIDIIGEAGLSAESRPSYSSDTHALWLDDVMEALSLPCASIVGVSLGGWLALDYAIRRPGRVAALALLAPGGIARNRNALWWALPLMMAGRWGIRKVMDRILGPLPPDAPPAVQHFRHFMTLIFENLRPRTVGLPVFPDSALQSLQIPLLAVFGGRDTMVDSLEIKERIEHLVKDAEIAFLPDTGHDLGEQARLILEFLRRKTCPSHTTFGVSDVNANGTRHH
jgi:pimeloyl-ACP methyl ester carboxylesterase